MSVKSDRVLVLGAGKMVEAILTGLKKSENLSEWVIYSPSGVSAQKLATKVGAKSIKDLQAIDNPDWVMIGCKPQQLVELSKTLNGQFKDSLFVSILAALTEKDQTQTLGINKLIRVMPNLPVEFNEGISLLTSESAQDELPVIEKLFKITGETLSVNEKEFEELTLLTGSGPAFFYEFASRLSDSFEALDSKAREVLVRQVFIGSALSVKKSRNSLTEMTDAVTSKGGVTIAVLEEWRSLDLTGLFKKGILKGIKRTNELKTLLRK